MSDDWRRLQNLFHAAESLEGEDRAAYLLQECSDDKELRKKVESLLEASEIVDDFLDKPVFSLGMRVMTSDSSEELINQVIGSFKILSLLGKGGMGNVYLAEDTQLGRKVALKFISGKLASDQWAKRQFIKEAQAIAMLDHPNICTVHGFEEKDNHSFIVMQYIEGDRLDKLIERGKLALKDALYLALQIGRALSVAHAHGIIHRDIKSSNIIVSANRQPIVLDFGLAKIVQQSHEELSGGTLSSNSLQLGFIPGTVSYMSPEQLRGEKLDFQTDIFSFGVLLYEMLSGTNPFTCPSKAETISAILVGRPQSLKLISTQISLEFERIIQKCLQKEKSERYQSISELLTDLESLEKLVSSGRRKLFYPGIRTATAAILLMLLVIVSTFIYSHLSRPRSLAILPIANETGDGNLNYLGDGLTESVINHLSGLSKLRVKAFNTVSGFRGPGVDPKKIGKNLNVDAVVTGKLTGTRELLSLQIAVINTVDGSEVWNRTYKVELEGLFHIEDDVSRQMIAMLELWPSSDQKKMSIARRPRNPEAHDQFMLGRNFWRLRDKANINRAIEHFQEAVKLDPLYAQAYAGLAESYLLLNTVHYGNMDTKEAMAKAEWAAREALDLDPTLPEAHTTLGDISLKRNWNWSEAEKEFKLAIEINPEYPAVHYSYSTFLVIAGRFSEAIFESEIANNLDPFSPVTNLNYCRTYYYARDYDRASTCFEKLVKEQPDYLNGQYLQGLVYLQRGMYQDATRTFEHLYAADRASAGAALGFTYGVTGRKTDALAVLAEVEALKSEQYYISPQEFAIIYIGLGDNENALIWLKKAAGEHFAPLAYIGVDPLFDPIRSDPGFVDLVKSLNLPLRAAG